MCILIKPFVSIEHVELRLKNTLYFINPWVFLARIVINMDGWFKVNESNINFKKGIFIRIFSKLFHFTDHTLYALTV